MIGLLDYLKIGAGAALGIGLSIVVYEGVPLGPLRDVPVIGPVLAFVVDGRVDRVAARAVKDKVAELDAATNQAIGELTDAADRADFLLVQCRLRGGVYDFGAGVCVERETE
jgi:hypothetical protein